LREQKKHKSKPFTAARWNREGLAGAGMRWHTVGALQRFGIHDLTMTVGFGIAPSDGIATNQVRPGTQHPIPTQRSGFDGRSIVRYSKCIEMY